jgi:catechol 2,3-dioxygenase-like lactoylglutathione lyase family enzyme
VKFGYTIIYVPDVLASVEFFEKAFGLRRRFVLESGYREMDTGATALASATHELGASNLLRRFHWSRKMSPKPTQRH